MEPHEQGFDAELRGVDILTADGDLINRCERFDEADLDAALARFDELSRLPRPAGSTASRVCERFSAHLAAGDWGAIAESFGDNFSLDDRRQVVGAGVRHGRDDEITDLRTLADLGLTGMTSTVMATRGERLFLVRARMSFSDREQGPEAYLVELFSLVEIAADERIVGLVGFDLDDIDAAIAELDARYIAGEGAAHQHTWSAIMRAYAAIDRHELPSTTPDWVNIDHRQGRAFAPGDLIPYIHATWDVAPQSTIYIEAVHRLSNRGAVVTNAMIGSSQEGFDAEWREVFVLTLQDDKIDRCELFDEADLDTALARFEELLPRTPRLENTASQIADRVMVHFSAREWDAAAELVADDFSSDDRRRTVNAGIQQGRDAAMKDAHANADVGAKEVTSTVIAARGEHLVLRRARYSGSAQRPEAFYVDALSIYEINGDGRVAAVVNFDIEDIDAAFEELDARYLAGEASAHAHTWSIIAGAYAALNRHELPAATQDWVNIDHRRLAMIEAGDLTASIRAGWDLAPDSGIYVEAVHRLSNLGAVVTWAGYGTSREGFDAESKGVSILTVDSDLISRCELFDETDLDAAIARFEELQPRAPRLENAAGRILERYQACFSAPDWAAMAELLADDIVLDDRRRVVNAGVRRGRDVHIADMRAAIEVGADTISLSVIATRGERLALAHARAFNRGSPSGEVGAEWCGVAEIDADERIVAMVSFDFDDIDAAYEELDARYLAGEAAAHAYAWSFITRIYTAFNRHEVPPADLVTIDHRRGTPFASSTMTASISAVWDLTPDFSIHIEAVHRLSSFGAVVTHASTGTSPEGFDAEWRMIQLLTFEGDRINGCELFDEADLDAALARFEELQPQALRLENAASRVFERFSTHWVAREWDSVTEKLADDIFNDDRRRVVGAGVRHGRDATVASMRASAGFGLSAVTSTVIATRGERLALSRDGFSICNPGPEEVVAEVLGIVEIGADERIVARLAFDLDDFDAAIAELDARYVVGEAAPYASTWSVIARADTATNRHEALPTTPDCVTIDHRLHAKLDAEGLTAYLDASWDLTPDLQVYVESVHRLSALGAVVTHASHGTSHDDFDAEWRQITLLTVEGDLGNRCEIFDEANLDIALNRFEELHPPTRRLENTASRMHDRFNAYLAVRDWDAMAEMVADDICHDDRRRVVSGGFQRGRDAHTANLRAIVDVGVKNFESLVIATRGERLVLTRTRVSGDERPEAFGLEFLSIIEIGTENRIAGGILFDLDDIDAALAELDARYLAGEAAAHAQTWSVITNAYAAVNRRELPPTTPDWISVDHRRGIAFPTGELGAYLNATWDLFTPSAYIETVHRLSDLGAVVTRVVKGTSPGGFDAEWREIGLSTVKGGLINRSELFDEADLDAALARFDELQPRAPRLENAASLVAERFPAHMTAHDWNAMTDLLAADVVVDDRRHGANAGIRHGREAAINDMRAAVDVGFTHATSTAIAARGERLALMLVHASGPAHQSDAYELDILHVVEINADGRTAAVVVYDREDIDAAFEELDARHLAGEAAPYARVVQRGLATLAELNRHEPGPMLGRLVYADHRRIPFGSGEDFRRGAEELWALVPDARYRVPAVHALDNHGEVVSFVIEGTDVHGNELQWGRILLFTPDEPRLEVYEEDDLDAALARFEELRPQAPRPENAASQAVQQLGTYFAARDWAAIAEILANDICTDDRRRVVNAGMRHGRDAEMKGLRATASIGTKHIKPTPLATRGQRLVLSTFRFSSHDQRPEAFHSEVLGVAEINGDNRIAALVMFDLEDIDAAFAELDARYLVGEAVAHARTWSVIAGLYAGFNQHERPATTPGFTYLDHRPVVAIEAGDLDATIHTYWDLTPGISIYADAVHRLSDLGAVLTHTSRGVSHDDFDAEWRMIAIFTVEGDLISRCEMFGDDDLDAALARFDALS